MKLLVLGLALMILGAIAVALTYHGYKAITSTSSVSIPPHSYFHVSYPGNSEVVFTYNFTLPVVVSGYSSSATLANNSLIYEVCFFSTSPGELTVFNPNNASTLVHYALQYVQGRRVDFEYGFVLGLIVLGGGAFSTAINFLLKPKKRGTR
ncbi:MAG: hypothetical protein MPF33_08105 [Candidatus Aramenus sp.]|jgi:hypothetical protein|nr:hypothetical protein [Candidatus Aramenus sp.]